MPKYKRGDWVRFMRDGKLVIGVVEYDLGTKWGCPRLMTDCGEISDEYVLEMRPRREPESGKE